MRCEEVRHGVSLRSAGRRRRRTSPRSTRAGRRGRCPTRGRLPAAASSPFAASPPSTVSAEVARERLDGRVVEHQRGRQLLIEPEAGAEQVAQLHGHQRVEPQLVAAAGARRSTPAWPRRAPGPPARSRSRAAAALAGRRRGQQLGADVARWWPPPRRRWPVVRGPSPPRSATRARRPICRRKTGQSIGTTPDLRVGPAAISAPSASRPWSGVITPRPWRPDALVDAVGDDRADLGPRAPVDAEPGQPAGPPVRRPARRGSCWRRRGWPARASRTATRPRRTGRSGRGAARAVSSWRFRAPSTLGASTVAKRDQSWRTRAPSSSTPAAWMTPRSGWLVAAMAAKRRGDVARVR